MSKHQACIDCRRDFVGPDSDIGNNYCPECEQAIFGEHMTTIKCLEADRDEWKRVAEDNTQGMIGQKAIIEKRDKVIANLNQEMKKFSCCCEPMCCHRVPEKQLVECEVCGKYV